MGGFAAAWVAWRVDVPREIPSFALQAAPVYRLEVGGAVFAAAYLASMALALALNNRVLSEIGAGGMRAQDIVGERGREVVRDQAEGLEALRLMIARVEQKFERLAEGKGNVKANDN